MRAVRDNLSMLASVNLRNSDKIFFIYFLHCHLSSNNLQVVQLMLCEMQNNSNSLLVGRVAYSATKLVMSSRGSYKTFHTGQQNWDLVGDFTPLLTPTI